jgi:hypothetical protein
MRERSQDVMTVLRAVSDAPVEITFVDGGKLILRNFVVGKDLGEKTFHCTAIIVEVVSVSQSKRQSLHKGEGLFFKLCDVSEIRAASDSQVLYTSPPAQPGSA